jgi:uncharacterized protein YkwD
MHILTSFLIQYIGRPKLSFQAGDLMYTDRADEQAGNPPEAVMTAADFKAEVLRLVNAEREKKGAGALIELDALAIPADIRAHEASVIFSHTRPDGTRCFTVLAEHSLKYRAAGENLANGFSSPAAAVKAWMKSKGHRQNILDPVFKYSGVGYFLNPKGRIYCAQLFYKPKLLKH